MKSQLAIVPTVLIAAMSIQSQSAAAEKTSIRAAATAPAEGKNDFYKGNRAPLRPSHFVKLPIGAIRPEGWVRQQLVLEADGFSGRLPELSKWCQFDKSAWTKPNGAGEFGWEELPYWLKGYVDLGYVLGDQRIIADAKKWIDAIIATQRPDGYFGTEVCLKTPDLWPNMVTLYVLRSHFEATGDERVIPLMTKYCRWLQTVPKERYLPESWQKWRGGDLLDSIYWLYNRTGEAWLLEFAKFNHSRTAEWNDGIPTWHGVNICQGFREPAQFFQQSGDAADLEATIRNYNTVWSKFGQVPGGMFGADENARDGFGSPRQGAESCSMVEFMWSCEMLSGITGDPMWLDRCEDVTFNSLPCSATADLKALHYLTAPNQIQLDRADKSPMIENDGDMFSFNPHAYRCCQHNVAFGWPYYAEHLWMATPGNGLAAMLYAPSSVIAKVGDGTEVKITEKTDYPFGETIEFTVAPSKPVKFPLTLRAPAWCNAPKVTLNGASLVVATGSKGWMIIDRTWNSGDVLKLELPMTLSVRTWKSNHDSISIDRGPLTYALKIDESWKRYGGTDAWPAFEVFPASPWNYGVIVDPADPASSIEVIKRSGALAAQPFTLEAAPIRLKVKARRVPEWKQEANGLVGQLQQSPVRSLHPIETVTLVPMGCARLRIASFPRVGSGADGHQWK